MASKIIIQILNTNNDNFKMKKKKKLSLAYKLDVKFFLFIRQLTTFQLNERNKRSNRKMKFLIVGLLLTFAVSAFGYAYR